MLFDLPEALGKFTQRFDSALSILVKQAEVSILQLIPQI